MFLSQVTNISFWFFFSTWSNGVHSWWWPVWDIFFVSNIFFLFQIFFSMWSNGVHSSWWPVGDLGQCSHNLPPHCWLTGTLSEITNRHEPTNTKHAKTIHTHANKHKNYTNTQCKRDNNDSRLLTDWLRANSNGQTKKGCLRIILFKVGAFLKPSKDSRNLSKCWRFENGTSLFPVDRLTNHKRRCLLCASLLQWVQKLVH